MVQVGAEVVGDVLGIRQQSLQGEGREVVEVVPRRLGEESRFHGETPLVELGVGVKHLLLGRCKHIRETLDNAHRQHHIAVFVGLVSAYEFVGDSPYKVRFLLYIDGCPFLQFFG